MTSNKKESAINKLTQKTSKVINPLKKSPMSQQGLLVMRTLDLSPQLDKVLTNKRFKIMPERHNNATQEQKEDFNLPTLRKEKAQTTKSTTVDSEKEKIYEQLITGEKQL